MVREDMETMPDKNNILIVGNGLDRLAGYNTDYLSFLKNNMSHYSKLIDEHIDRKLDTLIYEDFYSHSEVKLPRPKLKWSVITNTRFSDPNEVGLITRRFRKRQTSNEIEIRNLQSYFDKDRIINKEYYLSEIKSLEKVNTWIAYFIAYHVKHQNYNGYWVDLERLIFNNESSKSKIELKYVDFLKEYTTLNDGEIFQVKHKDFLEMKELLVEYLKKEKNKKLQKRKQIDYTPLRKYGTILNFNYSTSDLLNPNLNWRTPRIEPHQIDEIFIHGNFDNGKNIVFGFDDGMSLNRQTNEYEINSIHSKKYSKTHQLLTLATSVNSKLEEQVKIPEKYKIPTLGVLGHSIGQADYNYFETLCDFDDIILEIFWYSFEYQDKTGKRVRSDNKQESIDAVINMIHEMEKRQKKTLLHRMLIEQRIVFKQLHHESKNGDENV